jgi:homoserine/homoserine lactone efflux protein
VPAPPRNNARHRPPNHDTDTLLIYVVASLALAVIPGPTMLLALSNGIDGGMRRASWGIAGASLGSITLIAVVALGLGSLLAASELLFNAIRVAGVVYLVWLGVKLWRSEATDLRHRARQVRHRSPAAWPHRTGAQPGSWRCRTRRRCCSSRPSCRSSSTSAKPQGPQYLLLGAIFVVLDTCVMLAYAAAGTQAVRWLSRRGLKAMNRGCAVGMWLLAATLAFWRREPEHPLSPFERLKSNSSTPASTTPTAYHSKRVTRLVGDPHAQQHRDHRIDEGVARRQRGRRLAPAAPCRR